MRGLGLNTSPLQTLALLQYNGAILATSGLRIREASHSTLSDKGKCVPILVKEETPHLGVLCAWKSLGENAQEVAEGVLERGEAHGFHFILCTPLIIGKHLKQ